jgi:integrase
MGGKHLKSKVLKKPIEEYASIKYMLTGLKPKSQRCYKGSLKRFFEWLGKEPDVVLAERKKQLKSDDEKVKRTYEQIALKFYEHQKQQPGIREGSARTEVGAVQAFFSRNYAKLVFRRGDVKKPKTEERYVVPTLDEIREMVESTFSPRDKAVILLSVQTGLAPVDLIALKRAPFDRAIQKRETPTFVGKIAREKTGGVAYIFLMRDSAEALKRYFRIRKDDSDLLFVERGAKPMDVNSVNTIVKKAAKRAGLFQDKGQRIKGYVLRKVFETQMQKSGMPQAWTDLLMAHEIKGSREAYTRPSETELLEKVKNAEQFLSISHVRNVDILRDKIDKARQDDTLELIVALEQALGKEKMLNMAQNYLKVRTGGDRPKKHIMEKEDELLSSGRVLEFTFAKYLVQRGRPAELRGVKKAQLEKM